MFSNLLHSYEFFSHWASICGLYKKEHLQLYCICCIENCLEIMNPFSKLVLTIATTFIYSYRMPCFSSVYNSYSLQCLTKRGFDYICSYKQHYSTCWLCLYQGLKTYCRWWFILGWQLQDQTSSYKALSLCYKRPYAV